MPLSSIAPQNVWKNFSKLNAVPRASKKEEAVIAFMVSFGEQLALETYVDSVGNVIIKKPATPGFENRKTVVLQSHLDMVHQKNNDTEFDFETQGIEMFVDGDWVKAKGTTLGADNGLGVAAIMSILESTDIPHPPLEALFTIDEETGMTGAFGLVGNLLTGDILLNLDTEEDNEIGVGCAGGIDVTASKPYEPLKNTYSKAFRLTVKGLKGGHSGMDIHLGLGNANKLMNRILFALATDCAVARIDGGGLRNAIPRESNAIIVPKNANLTKKFKAIRDLILAEYATLEPSLDIALVACDVPETIMADPDLKMLIRTVYALPNGVFRMSPDIEGLVETSNNVARIVVDKGQITCMCLTRSSIDSGKDNLTNQLNSVFKLGGFTTKLSGSYPGWKPNPASPILKVLQNTYTKLFNEEANVLACHAGLECGILGQNYPAMDMISFGPTIKGAHSPDERASISSTQKFWKFLQEILANIPEKA